VRLPTRFQTKSKTEVNPSFGLKLLDASLEFFPSLVECEENLLRSVQGSRTQLD